MKSIPVFLAGLLGSMILALSFSGCNKDDQPEDKTSVVLDAIEDIGYTYAVVTGTFTHNQDFTLALYQIYYSDEIAEPTASNGQRPIISGMGDGTLKILQDTLGQILFECRLIELQENTTYYVRCASLRNSTDTLYSNAITFTTMHFEIQSVEFNPGLIYGQLSDIEGNTYKTIAIGTQTWMAENLKTTKFNNGTSIPLVTNTSEFLATTDPAYCNFEHNAAGSVPLGKLYNWYVVDERNLCPTGWHVASAADWDVLDEFVMQHYYCSGKALASKSGWKEAFWYFCNIGRDLQANDSTGFSAIAAGAFEHEVYGGLGHAGVWWSPDASAGGYQPSSRYLTRGNSSIGINYSEEENKGYSVRCVKN